MFPHRFKTFLEVAAVFAVFFLFGAWKTPDVNETHYIGKAIHYWNPDWIPGDPFLESRDAHWTFYFVFGWLSFFCSPPVMAWIGRIVAWGLLAWSWQRLSFALIPVRWAAIPTALALAYYIEAFNMAGEWLIGGIEGKSLAYPFVFFALAAILHNQWNRAGIFLGIACALHVLVGGWATFIATGLYVVTKAGMKRSVMTANNLPSLRVAPFRLLFSNFPWIGLIVGGLLALCGLIPVLMLNAGASEEVVRQAHKIYMDRLPHHLVPYLFKDSLMLRFALLTIIWIVLCRQTNSRRHRLFNGFIWGTLGIAAVGVILGYSLRSNPELAASVLRLYWFRLSDIAVPMGVAIGSVGICIKLLAAPPAERMVSQAIPLTIIIAAIYFTAAYLCFGYFNMWLPDATLHTTAPWVFRPDATIPWAMTLLVCLGIFRAATGRSRSLTQSSDCGSDLLLPSAVCRLLLYIAVAFYAPLTALPHYASLRTHAAYCRSEPVGPSGRRADAEWIDMCREIKKNTPPDAKFWIPRDGYTFKWHAQRADIGVWKNIPQDATSIVKWRRAMEELFRFKDEDGNTITDRLITTLLNSKTDEEIVALREKYGFDYILCSQSYAMPHHADSHSTLELVYENDVYCLYRVGERMSRRPDRKRHRKRSARFI